MRVQKLYLAALALFFAACAHHGGADKKNGSFSERSAEELSRPQATSPSFEDLKREEFKRPRDPAIKLELARHFWCRKERGIAVEHWLWLRQFAPRTQEGQEAQGYLSAAQAKKESSLDRSLKCAGLHL